MTTLTDVAFDLLKYNPNHDKLGRFGSGSDGASVGHEVKATGYHGGHEASPTGEDMTFYALQPNHAQFYADNFGSEGKVHEAPIHLKNAGTVADIEAEMKVHGIKYEDMVGKTPMDGDGPFEGLYMPQVRSGLKAKGFDGIEDWDILGNQEIKVVVVFK